MTNITKSPVLFVSHGSPMMAVEKSTTSEFLQKLGKELPIPTAIVVFSAHLDRASDIIITSGTNPKTVHDFYGFPPQLYAVNYPASGDPTLAKQIANKFVKADLVPTLSDDQGWDHGVWIPLRLMFPKANVPVVQISINSELGAEKNFQYGEIISDLRDQGVLIVGSGGISHNLRELFNPQPTQNRTEMVNEFTGWVHDKLQARDIESLLNYEHEAPHARFNHPTQEHFLPLIAALGSSDLIYVERVHQDIENDVLAMDAYLFS
ncbi:DODA-type extradiol aromatic ring-opening family dioxygenase [Vibrio algarum]|uniref:Class III extradiol ring-cleavage dioxygenase n=1 Tax=Vibrio algarum TaxID=3020714 RepID=A0ABT4YR26_9VIBR|nr:class III extradiol ring-cleavage dioxygenase [Vibrio sp. KJ40-1]MDB1124009.1 class III extradiol ring-cleavage dioxygenase [Vibrio sp. KJ40-1]